MHFCHRLSDRPTEVESLSRRNDERAVGESVGQPADSSAGDFQNQNSHNLDGNLIAAPAAPGDPNNALSGIQDLVSSDSESTDAEDRRYVCKYAFLGSSPERTPTVALRIQCAR